MYAVIALLLTAAVALPQPIDDARRLYQSTRYAEALQLLDKKQDPASLQLAGQCLYMSGDYKKAIDILEKALPAAPNNSNLHLWLGRVYGRRAETAMPLIAPKFASKARQSFEKAIELDPKNLLAMNDLFEYYMQAPGFLGGGKDKAAQLALRIAQLDKAEGHFAQATLAEDRKDFAAAEQQLRLAIDAAPGQIGRILDLAKFLARHNRPVESEAEFQRAEKLAPNSPKLLYDRAHTYIQTKRNLDQARTLLKRYLQSPLTPDDPSRQEAEKLLRSAGA